MTETSARSPTAQAWMTFRRLGTRHSAAPQSAAPLRARPRAIHAIAEHNRPSSTHTRACRPPTGQVRVPARRLGVHCPVVPQSAAANGPGQGYDTSLPSENDPARRSPRLAAPLRTKFGRQPADSESNARLYRHVRPVIMDSTTRDNGQPPMPIRVVALPDLPLLNGPSPPQDRLG